MQVKVNYPIVFDLSDEEVEEYSRLTTEQEKIDFLLEIADYFFDTEAIDPEIELITYHKE